MTSNWTTDIPQLADLRARVLRDEPVTPEEYAIVLDSIRQHRRAGAARKAAVAPADTSGLLNDLLNNVT